MKDFTKGFTIIELLVVIAIIAVLAAIVLVNVQQFYSEKSNYKICAKDDCDFVESYQEFDNCVRYGETKVCGDYKIQNLK